MTRRRARRGLHRQPGFFALGFGLDGATGPVELDLPQDRHFFGHGAFFDDGWLLAATENDFDGGRGVLGIYDASLAARTGAWANSIAAASGRTRCCCCPTARRCAWPMAAS
ncbi:DUF1513 domain-containing protein [Achromobacter xylosoxidans]